MFTPYNKNCWLKTTLFAIDYSLRQTEAVKQKRRDRGVLVRGSIFIIIIITGGDFRKVYCSEVYEGVLISP